MFLAPPQQIKPVKSLQKIKESGSMLQKNFCLGSHNCPLEVANVGKDPSIALQRALFTSGSGFCERS